MRKAWICAALAVLQAGFPCRAASHLEPPDLGRYLRWGVLRVRPGFELENFGYDSNIVNNAAEPVPDWTATVFGKLDGLLLFGSRGFLTFTPKLGYTGYLRNPDQSFPIYYGKSRVTIPVKRLGVFAETVLRRDTEFPLDVADIRPDRLQVGGGIGLILEPGWRTTIEVSRQVTDWAYNDPDFVNLGQQSISEALDRTVRGDKLAMTYDLVGRTSLTLEAQGGNIDFDSLDPIGRSKDSKFWTFEPGVAFGEGGRLTGRAKFGWTEVNSDDPTLEDFSGPVWNGSLAFRPVARARLQLQLERRPTFAVTSTSTFVVNNQLGLNLLYYFNRIIGLEGGVTGQRITFPGSVVELTERVDTGVIYDLAVRFRMAQNSLGRRVEYRLRWRSYHRTSPIESQNISRGQLGFGAVVGF